MNLDAETYEALGFQVMSTWDLCVAVEIDAELRRERVRRNDKRPKAKRPEKCACGKPLVQNLEGRVRHYCNRTCERRAKFPKGERICACGKPCERKWCSEQCRKTHAPKKKQARPSRAKPLAVRYCACGKQLTHNLQVWCSRRCLNVKRWADHKASLT